jgi:hypothetical protein
MPDARWGYGFPRGGVPAFDVRTPREMSKPTHPAEITLPVAADLTGLRHRQFPKLARGAV